MIIPCVLDTGQPGGCDMAAICCRRPVSASMDYAPSGPRSRSTVASLADARHNVAPGAPIPVLQTVARDAGDGLLEHDGIKGGESTQVQRQPGRGRVPIGTIPARPRLAVGGLGRLIARRPH